MSHKWKKPGPIPTPPTIAPTSPAVLNVPTFARLDEYVGAWAMEPQAANALWQRLRSLDLKTHVAETPPPLRSAIEMQPGRNGKKIALIKVIGTLMKQQSSTGDGTSTVQLRRDVRQAANDPDVSAILLAIDSPGGTVAGTEDLATDIRAAAKRKPVWAQIEDLGASAAYWLASQTERIFANAPTALVGSIGTLLTVYDVSGAADEAGLKAMVFTTGPVKGAGIEGSPVTDEQAAYFQGIVDDSQKSFDAAVKSGRGLTEKQLSSAKTGGVFSAPAALDMKLIDGIQPLETTLAQLAKAGWDAGKTQNTKRAQTPMKGTEAKTMEFQAWAESLGIDIATVSEERLSNLQAAHAAIYPSRIPPPEPDPIQVRRRAEAAEAQRITDIRRVCAAAGSPSMTTPAGSVAVEAHAIAEGWDVDRARMAAELEQLRASRVAGPGIVVRSRDTDCTLEALQGAMILRANRQLDHPAYQTQQALALGLPAWIRAGINAEQRQRAMESAHRFADMSSVDLCREALRLDGRDAPFGRGDVIRAAFSGSALTNIFTTNVNAVMLASYSEVGDTTGGWTSTSDVADFKTNERPRMARGPNLAKLPRGGEADHYDRSDLVETFKIARYAKQFVVDEQDMIDDNLSALSDMPTEMGQAAARLRPDLVYAIILRNAALGADSLALFLAATHANLNTTAALASATLRTAIAALEKQRENGVNLGLRATHLIVPTDLKHTGAELINSSQIIAGGDTAVGVRGNINTINSAESLTLVSEARLSNGVDDPVDGVNQAGSTTTWYVASAQGHNIEVAYLRGTGRAPQVRSFTLDAGKWGIGWDLKMDIGAKALDFRGMQKNTA